MTNVAVIGTGYVGLVTGVVLSEIGHTVTCIDLDEQKVNSLKLGMSPIYEPSLDELMVKSIESGRLYFTTNHQEAFVNARIVFIAVGTPQSESGAADLSYIQQAAKDIALKIVNDTIIVVKSTVPIGTNDLVEKIIYENLVADVDVNVVSNPEFLREGHAIHDTFHGDRIVIGAESIEAGDTIEQLFNPLEIPVVRTNRRSAEMIKYAANAFLATKISYINEIANLCEKMGANVLDVADGMGLDHRIGRAFLNPGLGYGGSCFPKDTEAIAYLGRQYETPLTIVESAIKANFHQRELFLHKVLDYFHGNVEGKIIGMLGLAFKPNTDDLREAPSLYLIEELEKRGAIVKAYDPVVKNLKQCVCSVQEVLINSNAVLLVTEWDEFKKANIDNSVIFDGRYIYGK
ncbi:UDP-glucose/GDP-mannose dehydrogenase family protein [Lysinibacillus agricola]|uniref:UDP-glucose 6-dehydrogenase n=1 Tax=Lysinibacillus agricola TaxID=2590012 RepID=A0ABX7AUR6_9BACI|nr:MULTISPECIES: UDP-glucose/GDP-mannose dehydrogenase family protein [Lysinibacillus]KOS60731.1 UDP-glucose 6-dehydrogenase [Lysinibacillus sp. FJAT-14222]QQP13252.1 UDP-glucose/GDP-mannose dehydrogenase family protein [Lysinibacillus agricola]